MTIATPPSTTNPIDGSPLPQVAATPVGEVAAAVARVRAAQRAWEEWPLKDREKAVLQLARLIVERRVEGAAIMSPELGRTPGMCEIAELNNAVNAAKGAVRAGRKALKTTKIGLSPLEYPGKKVVVEAVPRGVVGIIAPWNYPVGNFLKSLYPALLAGNGVVLKPSEHTPRSGAWLADLAQRVTPPGLVQVIQGGGEVGRALVEAGVDAVVFTGSVATGRRVAAACGERLIPCSVELGGKDAAVVLADCDLDRTALGLAQWSMFNSGQDCSSIERAYVDASIADALVERLARVVGHLRVATSSEEAEIGAMQNAAQLAIVEDHVADALAQGAKLVTGGQRVGPGLGYAPTVLDGCTHQMRIMREETFGPVLPICRVKDAGEAVRLANDSRYGLNGSVWTRDVAKGALIARTMEVGVALVNNHSVTGTLFETPWTGVKETGFGIASSQWAYGTFVRRRTVLVDKSKDPDPFWFPADETLAAFREALANVNLGAGLGALIALAGLVGKRIKAIRGMLAG